MHAIHLTAYGDPIDGLSHVEIPEPSAPEENEVLIQVEFSPLNPSDLLLARGVYAVRPELPAVIGNEGVGTIAAIGAGVTNVKTGDRVLIPRGVFAWAERVIAPATGLIVLPPNLDPQQASMLSINPPTAALLLSEFVDLKPGDWVVQNAGNSGVGRSVIALAKSRGLKTVSIVRRLELVEELNTAGGDIVLVDSSDIVQQIKDATKDAPILLGLDGVSGAATGVLGAVVTLGGVIVSYAAMSGQAMGINPRDVIFKKLTVKGFFMLYPEFLPKLEAVTQEGAVLAAAGQLHVPVAATYPLTEIKAAVAHVIAGGKVLLDIGATR